MDGAPFPELVWRKDGQVLSLTSRIRLPNVYSTSLFFESLELSDTGVYECSVENGEGADVSTEGEIIVLGTVNLCQMFYCNFLRVKKEDKYSIHKLKQLVFACKQSKLTRF